MPCLSFACFDIPIASPWTYPTLVDTKKVFWRVKKVKQAQDQTMASPYPLPLGLVGTSSLLSIITFASSLSQRNEHWQFHIPVVLGFFITIIYHTSTFITTRRSAAASTIDPSLLATNAVAVYCLLLTLWMIIFTINLVLCVATESRLPRMIILSTISAGLECIVLGRIAVKCDNAALNALYENPALRGQRAESDREAQGP